MAFSTVDPQALAEQLKGTRVALADCLAVDDRAVGVLLVGDDLLLLCRFLIIEAVRNEVLVDIEFFFIIAAV